MKAHGHAMMRRPVISWKRAANDNFPPPRAQDVLHMPFLARHHSLPLMRSEPFRIGARPLLIVCCSLVILVALCGAFLVGLAAVGVMAAAIAAFELARRYLRRKTPLGVLDHQAAS
jgi:hypothetical protein